jgi:hypothetical protein
VIAMMSWTEATSPGGHRIARLTASGILTVEETRNWLATFSPGGPWFGVSVLAIAEKGTKMDPEVRKLYADPASTEPLRSYIAILVRGSLMRVTINFLIRYRERRRGISRVFNDEASALEWLDQQIAQERLTEQAAGE